LISRSADVDLVELAFHEPYPSVEPSAAAGDWSESWEVPGRFAQGELAPDPFGGFGFRVDGSVLVAGVGGAGEVAPGTVVS
jgi:hypothetical protein